MIRTRNIDPADRDSTVISRSLPTNGECVDQCIFIATRKCEVVEISEVHSVAGNDASAVNLQVTKDTGTNAPGAGTDLLTNNTNAGFNMKGTANTVQTGSLVSSKTTKRLDVGDRLSLDFAGTLTTLAGVVVTVRIRFYESAA